MAPFQGKVTSLSALVSSWTYGTARITACAVTYIKETLSHASIATTGVYQHATPTSSSILALAV